MVITNEKIIEELFLKEKNYVDMSMKFWNGKYLRVYLKIDCDSWKESWIRFEEWMVLFLYIHCIHIEKKEAKEKAIRLSYTFIENR
jgi:hypothetical protein